MRKAQSGKKSREKNSKGSPLLEWQTVDNEVEWQAAQQEAPSTPVPLSKATLRLNWRHFGAALLIILAIIGGWTWSVAQRGEDQIEAELRQSVEADLWRATKDDRAIHQLVTTVRGDGAYPLTSTVHLIALPDQRAIVQVIIQAEAGQPPLRQTRFYRQTAQGWQHTAPDAEVWGVPRQMESSHFTIHFRQKDAPVVDAVAPQIDEVYDELQRNFGLSANGEKLVIEVTVEEPTGAMLTPQWAYEPLVVPSPAVYLAPVDLSDKALLAQSIALPLLEYMGQRALAEHAIPHRWQPLLQGLQLWQLWQLQMPLAQWRKDLVTWFYLDAPKAAQEEASLLPAVYPQLCAMHRLWMLAPEVIGIPLKCTARDQLSWSPQRWTSYIPRTRLDQLSIPLADWEIPYQSAANDPYQQSETVVVASLIDYVVAVYGDKSVPLLLTGLVHYDGWESLLPAVYGLSAAEFEAGWRAYMAKEYGVQPEVVQR